MTRFLYDRLRAEVAELRLRVVQITSQIVGGAPSSHASSHQNVGSDEISVAGLSGLLADGQTPLAHASSHQTGGSDAIKLDDLAAPDDNTDLNASTAKHGLLPKLPGGTTTFFRADGAFATPSGTGGGDVPLYFVAGASGGHDPADATTYRFGLQAGFNPLNAEQGFEVSVPVTGTVSSAYGCFRVFTTAGSSENVTVRVSNFTAATTENITTTLQLTSNAAPGNTFSNAAMTLSVTAGDRLRIEFVTPSWTTNPTDLTYNVTVMVTPS